MGSVVALDGTKSGDLTGKELWQQFASHGRQELAGAARRPAVRRRRPREAVHLRRQDRASRSPTRSWARRHAQHAARGRRQDLRAAPTTASGTSCKPTEQWRRGRSQAAAHRRRESTARRSFRTAAFTCRRRSTCTAWAMPIRSRRPIRCRRGRRKTPGDQKVGAVCKSCRTTSLLTPGDEAAVSRCAFSTRKGQLLPDVARRRRKFAVDGPGTDRRRRHVHGAGRERTSSVRSSPARSATSTGTARIRIMPPLPWKFDFNKRQDVPLTWIGGRVRWEVRDEDGDKYHRQEDRAADAQGPQEQARHAQLRVDGPDRSGELHDSGRRAADREDGGKMPDVGHHQQRLPTDDPRPEPASCGSIAGRRTTTARMPKCRFEPKPDTWYTLKLSVVPGEGTGHRPRQALAARREGAGEVDRRNGRPVAEPARHPGHLRQHARCGDLSRQFASDAELRSII